MATVTLDGLSKTYRGGVEAVSAVDLAVADGELIVIVGPSGCGKSTLLRMVAGLETITAGRLLIDGREVNRLEPAERDIAMVFQNYALYPHMSVYDNLAYGLRNRGWKRAAIAAQVAETAAALGLSDLLKRRPRELSGGQRQRVAMGRAIVRDPRVFLFDEPLSNLDAKLRVSMRLEIKRLQRALGVTALYVTHDQVEAMTLADRLVAMNAGRVEQIGTPMDLYERPASRFVAEFIGTPPMNILPARVDDGIARFGAVALMPVDLAPDTEISVGVRPEHFGILPPGQGMLSGPVEVVEHLGADAFAHVAVGPAEARLRLTVRAEPGAVPTEGAEIGLALRPGHVRLFDAAGRALPDPVAAPSAAIG